MATARERRYAGRTETPINATRNDIQDVLAKFGVTKFGYLSDGDRTWIGFVIRGWRVQIDVPMPDPNDREFTHTAAKYQYQQRPRSQTSRNDRYQEACRARWRAMLLIIKAKLAAIDAGVTTVEHEFLPYVLLPNGQTAGRYAVEAIEKAYATGDVPALLPPGGGQ